MKENKRIITAIFFVVILLGGAFLYKKDIVKYRLIDINGAVENIIGVRNLNEVTKLSNGSLVKQMKDPVWIGDRPEKVREFANKLEGQGISFIYVQVPYEICKYDDRVELQLDNSNAYADAFLQRLEANDIATIDLRESLHDEYSDHYDAFFITDHHWRANTAFMAMNTLVKELYGYSSEKTDISSYSCEKHEKIFLGSNGRRTGRYFGGLDDLDILTPEFETNLLYEDSDGNKRSGSYSDTLLFYEALEGDNMFEMSQYDIYLGTDKAMVRIRNNEPAVDSKVLFIKDSYSRPVIAFASSIFSEIAAIDLRYYNKEDFDGESVYEYITTYSPDYVIMMYNPFMLVSDENFYFD